MISALSVLLYCFYLLHQRTFCSIADWQRRSRFLSEVSEAATKQKQSAKRAPLSVSPATPVDPPTSHHIQIARRRPQKKQKQKAGEGGNFTALRESVWEDYRGSKEPRVSGERLMAKVGNAHTHTHGRAHTRTHTSRPGASPCVFAKLMGQDFLAL